MSHLTPGTPSAHETPAGARRSGRCTLFRVLGFAGSAARYMADEYSRFCDGRGTSMSA